MATESLCLMLALTKTIILFVNVKVCVCNMSRQMLLFCVFLVLFPVIAATFTFCLAD